MKAKKSQWQGKRMSLFAKHKNVKCWFIQNYDYFVITFKINRVNIFNQDETLVRRKQSLRSAKTKSPTFEHIKTATYRT